MRTGQLCEKNIMRIEVKEKGTKEFYEEVVNASSQYRSLIKNPDAKLRNTIKSFKIDLILCAVFLILLVVIGALWGFDTLTVIGIVLLVVVAIFCGAFLNNMNKAVKRYLEDQCTSVVTLDESGVELSKEGSNVIRLAWDNVAFVRVFKESVCFLSKDMTSIMLAVNIAHKQEILDYIRTSNVPVQIIE